MKVLAVAVFLGVVLAPVLAQQPSDQDSIRSERNASNRAIAEGDTKSFAMSLDKDFVVVTGNASLLDRKSVV